MKRERGGGEIEDLGDLAGGEAVRPRLDEAAVDVEPRLLRERGQGDDGIYSIHSSKIIEMTIETQEDLGRTAQGAPSMVAACR